eukprot:scaffold15100_cov61-Phaeocystis_antarctica.AAC.3
MASSRLPDSSGWMPAPAMTARRSQGSQDSEGSCVAGAAVAAGVAICAGLASAAVLRAPPR